MKAERRRLAVIGAGRAGSALARLLACRGWTIAAIASSRIGTARALARQCGGAPLATTDPVRAARGAGVVLIAVPDREIPGIAESMRGLGGAGHVRRRRAGEDGSSLAGPRIALHTSGASGADLLDFLRPSGWSVGSFHPLFAFPPRGSGAPDLTGAWIAIDGDTRARTLARQLARSLGARTLELPSRQRGRYHLAACFASNYLVTLAAEAVELLARAGLDRKEALTALLPLMRSTLVNLERAGLPEALTGPVARGDDVTIARHTDLLRAVDPSLRELHRFLVIRTVRIARSAGWLDAKAARRIERALFRNGSRRKTRR